MIPVWDLQARFNFHPVDPEKRQKMELLRSIAHSYATVINETCPDGREKSVSITKLEEVVFWANSALARYEPAQAEITEPNGQEHPTSPNTTK